MNIAELEKQIEELDKQYNIDFNAPTKTDMKFNLHQGIVYTTNVTMKYIPKKIELEIKLAMLKEKKMKTILKTIGIIALITILS